MGDIKIISCKPLYRLNDVVWFCSQALDHDGMIVLEMYQGVILEIIQSHHGVYYKMFLTADSCLIDLVPEKNIFPNKRDCLKSVLELIKI